MTDQNWPRLCAALAVVIGVTSWGPADEAALSGYEGASFFGVNPQFPGEYGTRGSGNIAAFMDYGTNILVAAAVLFPAAYGLWKQHAMAWGKLVQHGCLSPDTDTPYQDAPSLCHKAFYCCQ